ncbi:phenylalanine--tRNA ligase subunit alpha [Flavobacteriaceae bacterium]|jgi:phenylalanyl-tRNA synthetase alpha chain|nr:phenylalanine--tRNA ligase subunit alpha [Flavobacteriaceae bacterium]MEC8612179.1 phenylalanine--tRNA ligase subunit alpha [Bacteroidota bacterium]|tara:strand:+ start:410 stop:1414 length:1005 start_codon:yes stop_codon:yes gene_type:complete
MIDKLDEHFLYIKNFKSQKIDDIESLKIQYLGRKGIINDLFSNFKNVPTDQKKNYGQKINDLKVLVQTKYDELISRTSKTQKKNYEDYNKPGFPIQIGSLHPITIVKNRIIDVFSKLGFGLSESPEIEDDWHNFTALNLPEDHPARDMQDTFFIQRDPDLLLRTHCSTIQIRHLEENPPPAKVIQAGRVYRNEAISSRSHCIFHQVDGIYVDENVSFADLKQMVLYFAKSMFGKSKLRFRPSYFPFTEPSAEVDIYWGLETETDYRITKGTGWLEIMGCGMVDPKVLENCNIDSEKYTGYAFGMGIERIAMLIYQIPDIRLFFENDVRFLNQFK